MPLSLIGGQFYACYAQFLKDSRATSPQTTAPVMDAMLHQQKRRRRYPRVKISTADTPLLSQFVAMQHLNEAILNTYRLKAMPAKVTPNATPWHAESRLSATSSAGAQTQTDDLSKSQSPDVVLANVLTACSLVHTIVLHFSIVIEKIVSIQDDDAAAANDMALQDVDDSRTRTDLLELQLPTAIKPTK
ncbi:hypothetical protein AC1031_015780 [Aphanomyces cochlioides]|nr:hypothetical protein AC1031_015780 [Aphanomyces cochlioides]